MGGKHLIALMVLAIAIVSVAALADEPAPPPGPQPDDRCAVCGMFVTKYPNWVATVVMTDGSRLYFDGPKDMFSFLHDLGKYRRRKDEIAGVWVTDYYTTRQIPARSSFFVIGSDILGPMGAELVPMANEESARGFAADHGGGAVLRFDEIGPDQIVR